MEWHSYRVAGRLSSSKDCHSVVVSIRDAPASYDTELNELVGDVGVRHTATGKASKPDAHEATNNGEHSVQDDYYPIFRSNLCAMTLTSRKSHILVSHQTTNRALTIQLHLPSTVGLKASIRSTRGEKFRSAARNDRRAEAHMHVRLTVT